MELVRRRHRPGLVGSAATAGYANPDRSLLRTTDVHDVMVAERVIIAGVDLSRPHRSGAAGAGSEDSPSELVHRVALGDREAFAALYDLVAPLVHTVTTRVVRDPSIAEEVTQEVMVELWRTASRFDPDRGSVTAWAVTVAHRRSVDRVRSTQAARDRDQRDVDRTPGTTHDVVAEAVAEDLERDELTTALGALTDVQRQAIELAYWSGYTYREVATVLDVPEGTVKTRIRDGMARLRSRMDPT